MSRSHTRINTLNLLRLKSGIFFSNLLQLFLNIRLLFSLIKIVFPLIFQRIIRMPLKPQSSKTVLYHVVNNPVRGKQLCCCRYRLLGDLYILFKISKNLIFWLRIVILVQPSDNLNLILPVSFRYAIFLIYHLLNHTALTQQIVWQKKLRVVSNLLKHLRENARKRITLGNQKILEQVIIPVIVLQLIHLLHV